MFCKQIVIQSRRWYMFFYWEPLNDHFYRQYLGRSSLVRHRRIERHRDRLLLVEHKICFLLYIRNAWKPRSILIRMVCVGDNFSRQRQQKTKHRENVTTAKGTHKTRLIFLLTWIWLHSELKMFERNAERE